MPSGSFLTWIGETHDTIPAIRQWAVDTSEISASSSTVSRYLLFLFSLSADVAVIYIAIDGVLDTFWLL